MAHLLKEISLSFDDVLLVPANHSRVRSRKDPDVSTKISKHLKIKTPLISSCMDTVTEDDMAIAMWKNGGLGIIHRYNTIEKQCQLFKNVINKNSNCAVAIAATNDYLERAAELVKLGCNILCIDVANGHSIVCIEATKKIRKAFPNITLIAGNVSTGYGAVQLINAGADAIRLGIGPGSLCSTRVQTGCGKSAFQTIFDVKKELSALKYDVCLIADGGIKNSGDLTKALAAGADVIMCGQMFAATDESPGNIIEVDNKKYKKYQGMASLSAQVNWHPEKKDEIVPEGEDTLLLYKGSIDNIIYQLIGGLRSGMSYCNALSIKELQDNAIFSPITSAGWAESKPHAKQG